MADPQRFLLHHDGVDHVVTVHDGLRRRTAWSVAGTDVAEKTTTEEKVTLRSAGHGAVRLTFTALGRPRRVLWYADADDPQILVGTGGTDLHPEPGSKAALREDRILAHPTRHTVLQTLTAVAGVIAVPLGIYLLTQLLGLLPRPDIELPSIPWPDLPSIPWPDLPNIPWPDIPLPDLPDIGVPDWVRWILAHMKYVVPIVIAVVIARGEIKRRRDREKAAASDQP